MRVACPFCDAIVEVPDELTGARCRSCGEEFDVVTEGATVQTEADAPTVRQEPTFIVSERVEKVEEEREEEKEETEEGEGKKEKRARLELQWLRGQFEDRYELLELIGRGGMGAVFKARQKRPSRVVALKVMLSGGFSSQRAMHRFQREAQAAALLQHPCIVPLYEYGEVGGQPYYSMEYVEGSNLRTYVRQRRLGKRDICGLMSTVCRAVAYAHSRGVIHRDLKPGNIIVDSEGRPRVLDFGLSRISEDAEVSARSITRSGDVMGTPQYMSPEQASGKRDEVDEKSDVYSLGVILYELLVGMPPYDLMGAEGLAAAEVLRHVEPVKPSLLHSWMPEELEAILMKALEKDRALRYRSAGGLASDLDNFLADRPVSARPHTALYRLRKFAWRHRRVVFPSVLAAVVVVVLALGLLAKSAEVKQARGSLEWMRGALSKMEDVPAEVMGMAREGHWADAYAIATFAEETMRDVAEVRGLAGKVEELARQATGEGLDEISRLVREQRYELASARVAEMVEQAQELPFEDIRAEVEDFERGFRDYCWDELKSSVEQAYTSRMAGEFIEEFLSWAGAAPYAEDAGALLEEARSRSPEHWAGRHEAAARRELERMNWPQVKAVLDSASALLAGAELREADRWQQVFGELRRQFDSTIRAETVPALEAIKVLGGRRGMVKTVAFSPDGELLAAGGSDGKVTLWAVGGWEEARVLSHPAGVRRVAFSPRGNVLAVGCQDGDVYVWDVAQNRRLLLLAGHGERVNSLAFSHDGTVLAAGSVDGVKLWKVGMGMEVQLPQEAALSKEVAFSPVEPLLAARNEGGNVEILDLTSKKRLKVIETPGKAMRLAFSPDGRLLACAGNDDRLAILDVHSGSVVRTMGGHPRNVWSLAFSPDGRLLASASSDYTVRLWLVSTGECLGALTGHEGWVHAVAFSPDCRLLASGSNDKTVRIWGVPAAQLAR